jgi:uncharacterized protein YlxP (DUF503 family)
MNKIPQLVIELELSEVANLKQKRRRFYRILRKSYYIHILSDINFKDIMDKQVIELLKQVLANQAVIYKKLDDIESRQKGSTKLAAMKTYVDDLKKKSKEVLPLIID